MEGTKQLRLKKKTGFWHNVKADFRWNRSIYIMIIPVLAYYLIFYYGPMYGTIIAFKKYDLGLGILGSHWVGLKNFAEFFSSIYAWRVIRNTLVINVYNLIFGFTAPIILALLLNELRMRLFKKIVQTISYLPHFISIMVVCGMIVDFSSKDGLINVIIGWFGGEKANLLVKPELFRSIYVFSGIWQNVGWESIIYIAAMAAIDQSIYEAAEIDGCNRWRRVINVTLPSILPTIVILFILNIGNMMTVDYQKIILLYSPTTYETGDVISSFVYRYGLLQMNYSYSTAVGLFNSCINFIMLLGANYASKKVSSLSLW